MSCVKHHTISYCLSLFHFYFVQLTEEVLLCEVSIDETFTNKDKIQL